MYSAISAGEIVRIYKSKRDGKLIAYAPTGKVILIKNRENLKIGFGKIVSIAEKEKYYVATLEQIPYDIYYGYEDNETIPYSELKEVLITLNFTQQLTLPIDANNFFEVWANLSTGDLITIETWNYYDEKTYNSINLYVPTGNLLAFSVRENSGFSHGGHNFCCFNVINCEYDTPLHTLLRYSSKSKDWNGAHPALWHYGDGHDLNYAEILRRIYDCKDDIGNLFNMKIEESLKRYKEHGYV